MNVWCCPTLRVLIIKKNFYLISWVYLHNLIFSYQIYNILGLDLQQVIFISNLIDLKKLSKNWAHHKRLQDDHSLKQIENDLEVFETEQGGLYRSEEHKNHITSLYSTRGKYLKEKEDKWRLRSRAIWIQEGDANTKFYHKFANGRKAINTIWQLQYE